MSSWGHVDPAAILWNRRIDFFLSTPVFASQITRPPTASTRSSSLRSLFDCSSTFPLFFAVVPNFISLAGASTSQQWKRNTHTHTPICWNKNRTLALEEERLVMWRILIRFPPFFEIRLSIFFHGWFGCGGRWFLFHSPFVVCVFLLCSTNR